MDFECTPEFKKQVEKLSKNKSYRNLESELIEFIGSDLDNFSIGFNLNRNNSTPFIKKRLNGSGGYRLYYFYTINKETITLLYVHPKTGSEGFESIIDKKKSELMDTRALCKSNRDMFKIEVKNELLTFIHFSDIQ